jgi:uncharacterized protein
VVKPDGFSLFGFCAVLTLLSLPLWVIGAVVRLEIMPGLRLATLSFALPATTALLLAARRPGGAIALARRIADIGRVRSWQWGFVLMLTSPATFATAYGIAVARGANLGPARIDVALMLARFAVFLISALCEELGWTGYLLDPLNSQWGRGERRSLSGRSGRCGTSFR